MTHNSVILKIETSLVRNISCSQVIWYVRWQAATGHHLISAWVDLKKY